MTKDLNCSDANRVKDLEKINKVALANPDLTHDFIKNILKAQQEAAAGKLEPYRFE